MYSNNDYPIVGFTNVGGRCSVRSYVIDSKKAIRVVKHNSINTVGKRINDYEISSSKFTLLLSTFQLCLSSKNNLETFDDFVASTNSIT